MDKKLFARLLLEHQDNLVEIRMIALKFIRCSSQYIENDHNVSTKLKKTINRDKIVELFLKTSAMVIKLIPLEHQVIGSSLIKKHELEKFKHQQVDDLEISKEDLKIMKRFLKLYKSDS